MLSYILGITKRDNKRITNRRKLYGLQIGARAITNRGSLRGFKSVQKDYKFGQGFQIEAKRFEIGADITNQSKRDYKPGQGLQIGAEYCL